MPEAVEDLEKEQVQVAQELVVLAVAVLVVEKYNKLKMELQTLVAVAVVETTLTARKLEVMVVQV
jgi:hypothetical protein